MVEQVQFVNVSELVSIRVTCPNCQVVTETGFPNAGLAFQQDICHACKAVLIRATEMIDLVRAIGALQDFQTKTKTEICFPLRKPISE
jgi:hypothetical protein